MTAELFTLFLASTVRLAVPLLFAATGELVSERAGVVNMSVEGMMLTGAFGGAMGAAYTGSPMLGLCCAILAVLPIAVLQSVMTNTLRANQIVTGIGINITALGLTTLGYRALFGARSRDIIPGFAAWSPPLLGQIPLVGGVFQQVWLFYLAAAIIAVVGYVLARTGLGIVLRAAGDNPQSVIRSGAPLKGVRHAAVIFTGVMSALGGAFLSIGDIHTFTEGMTNGAGYLAIVAVIFGSWRLWRTVAACLLFGAATALQFQLPAFGIHIPNALLIMMPYLLALLAVAGVVGHQTAPRALTQN
ncbi:ABC transporter permease (plasmid) [Rhizobium leguminosarum]|uniref:ABC transporter permease n=1 Tax=Rhizobium leguminosarum TaxID=384 RepID=UPI001030B18B|nr:ABC transporter permease [Rhizobium leguminosarum]TAX48143.1 ABC transporter permease [Rhizobium leguminosarum]TAX86680.1 ABC transporter permease [Rhizobium leguminosarum]